jgi:hypothetical protein
MTGTVRLAWGIAIGNGDRSTAEAIDDQIGFADPAATTTTSRQDVQTFTGGTRTSCTAAHADACGTNFMAAQNAGDAPFDPQVAR